MRAKIRSGVSLRPTETDIRQAREAVAIALGKAEQPAFVIKARERWNKIRQSFEDAATLLDQTGVPADRALSKDVRIFLSERQILETTPDRVLKEAASRIVIPQQQKPEVIAPVRPAPARKR